MQETMQPEQRPQQELLEVKQAGGWNPAPGVRKLVCTVLGMLLVTVAAVWVSLRLEVGLGWWYFVAMCLLVLAYTVPNVLDKALQAGALGNLGWFLPGAGGRG